MVNWDFDIERMKIERVWAMPNKWTFKIKPIKELLDEEVEGFYVDPFSGIYSPATVKNDLDTRNSHAQTHLDALIFLKSLDDSIFDGCILDPPYSMRQASECYKKLGREKLAVSVTNMKYWKLIKDNMSRIIRPGGKAICFGWSSMGLGKNRGFEMRRLLLVPHGGTRNDTICTVERKKK